VGTEQALGETTRLILRAGRIFDREIDFADLGSSRDVEAALFFDIGNVFDTKCGGDQLNCFDIDPDELRYSAGIGVTWISGFGPMTFSLAKPLNASDIDREEVFQFTLGRGF